LGRPDQGRLEPGGRADIAVWPGDDLADMPDPVDALVLGPDRRVRHLLVGGEFVVRDAVLAGIDLHAARVALAGRARRLWR
ncbi:MAG: 8-oxoguanine deaminase, partial [Streptomycetales bacterium]